MQGKELKRILQSVDAYADQSLGVGRVTDHQALGERRETAVRLARAALRTAFGSTADAAWMLEASGQREQLLLWTATAAIAAQGGVLGECRRQTPYVPLRPVLTDSGLRWCCLHETEHCDG